MSHLQLLSLQFHLILHNTATGLNMYELIPQQPDTQYSRYFQHKQSENDFAKLLDRGKQIVTLTLLVVPAVPGAGSSPGGTSSPGGGSSTPAGGESVSSSSAVMCVWRVDLLANTWLRNRKNSSTSRMSFGW